LLTTGIGDGLEVPHNTRMTNDVFTNPLRQCCSLDWYKYPPDHRCPHDAWVESVTVSEPSSGERHENRGLEIHIRLLGAYHDGIIEFAYTGVQNYSMQAVRDVAGHGDWLEDEVDVKRQDTLLHKITLTNGSFEIEAKDVEYKWTPLPTLSGS
jgi:hypothetical protein